MGLLRRDVTHHGFTWRFGVQTLKRRNTLGRHITLLLQIFFYITSKKLQRIIYSHYYVHVQRRLQEVTSIIGTSAELSNSAILVACEQEETYRELTGQFNLTR